MFNRQDAKYAKRRKDKPKEDVSNRQAPYDTKLFNRQDAKYAKIGQNKPKEDDIFRKDYDMEPSPEVDQLAREVIGAAIEVHRRLGPGYLEAVYEESLCIELGLRGIPFVQQHTIAVAYKGRRVGEARLDLLVGEMLIVELKAVESLVAVHTAQVMSYLKATHLQLALLINFNVPVFKAGIKRIALSWS